MPTPSTAILFVTTNIEIRDMITAAILVGRLSALWLQHVSPSARANEAQLERPKGELLKAAAQNVKVPSSRSCKSMTSTPMAASIFGSLMTTMRKLGRSSTSSSAGIAEN